jgi:hypothetical protein
MPSFPFVIPVAERDALAWAVGQVNDIHLVLSAPLIPQVVFFGDLPDLASYRLALRQCRHWRDQGANAMIFRTGNQIVYDHIEKFGGIWQLFQDVDGRWRFLQLPAGFSRWLAKF